MALYQMRAFMNYDVRPSDDWTSSIEYDIDGSIDSSAVEDTAMSFATGLQAMLLENVVIDRIVVGTWLPDGTPYDPSTLRVIPLGLPGLVEFILGSPVDDDLTVFIRKAVSMGRAGKFFLRGCLTTTMISSASGSWILDGGAETAVPLAISDFYGAARSVTEVKLIGVSFIDWTYPATPEGTKQVPVPNYEEEPVVRAVSDFVFASLRERQDTQ
jgi:hypothetical protein